MKSVRLSVFLFVVTFITSCNPLLLKNDVFNKEASIPEDEALHKKNSLEWWYFTGHLYDKDSNEYGIEYVVFHFHPKDRKDHFLVNFAISDPQKQQFFYDYAFYNPKKKAEAGNLPLNLHFDQFQLRGQEGQYKIDATMKNNPIIAQLETINTKEVLLHDGTGYEEYGSGRKAGYYSYTRLQTKGLLVLEKDTISVSGELWYDRQWNCGNVLKKRIGWDWMSIQLKEQKDDIMLYSFKDFGKKTITYGGSYYDESNNLISLEDEDIQMVPLDYWTSGVSRRKYPIKWKVTISKIDAEFIVEAKMKHQELIIRKTGLKLPYWEGMCDVRGTLRDKKVTGNAYLEMTSKKRKQ